PLSKPVQFVAGRSLRPRVRGRLDTPHRQPAASCRCIHKPRRLHPNSVLLKCHQPSDISRASEEQRKESYNEEYPSNTCLVHAVLQHASASPCVNQRGCDENRCWLG